jgi:hypothetical protein
VTLNRPAEIDPGKTIRKLLYSHPVYTPAGRTAQRKREIAASVALITKPIGARFHEDGVKAPWLCANTLKGLDCTGHSRGKVRLPIQPVQNSFHYRLFLMYVTSRNSRLLRPFGRVNLAYLRRRDHLGDPRIPWTAL